MEIKITIDGLDQLTEAIALLGSALAYKQGMVKTTAEAVDLAFLTGNFTEKTEEATKPEEKVTEEPEKVTEPTITIEQVREAFMDKNSKANAPKLKALLKKYGVAKVTDLKEVTFSFVLEDLKEI